MCTQQLLCIMVVLLALGSGIQLYAFDSVTPSQLASSNAQSSPWERYKSIRLGKKTVDDKEEASTESANHSAPEGLFLPRADKKLSPVVIKDLAAETFSLVYTRVPRTTGRHKVQLKDGDYILESADIWDTLPDVRRKYSGFNAPGQLIYRATDGAERILFDCYSDNKPCVPLDPMVSFDGKHVLFSLYRGTEFGRGWWDGITLPNPVLSGKVEAQLHIVEIETGKITPLHHTPGVRDISPVWLPDGRILFASDRGETRRPWLHWITNPIKREPQLYIADASGRNAQNISPHEVTAAMHPYVLSNGRVAYSSHWLSHNLAYIGTNGSINWPTTLDNMWMVNDMDRDGGDMTALLGAHRHAIQAADGRTKTMKALHFLGQRDNDDICVDNYYRTNNLGLGDVWCWPPEPKGVEGLPGTFIPRQIYNVANWSKSNDEPSWTVNGVFQGKIGYPEGIPGNQLMLTVGRGYCTQVSGSVKSFQQAVANQPDKLGCDVGVYRTTQIPSRQMSDLDKIVDLPEWHEFGARIVRPRKVDMPSLMKSGTNACVIASSDAGRAETGPHRPYKFNDNYFNAANNGAEIDGLPHSELAAIRFYEVIPNRGAPGFKNSVGNQLKLLGDVPLLADKSFVAQLPCDTPYLLVGLDRQGRAIKRDQVPQSLRPGEKRVCTGCHLHSESGRPYHQSLAFSASVVPLLNSVPVPTFNHDVKPILQRRCASCHDGTALFDYMQLVWDPLQQHVFGARLQVSESTNEKRRYGLQRPYTSKYVNSLYARESLLYWKASNSRTDGRTDASYKNDIDFGDDHPTGMTVEELIILAEWLDAGAHQ